MLETILITHLVGSLSPGPDIVLCIQTALSKGRKAAVLTLAGILTGVFLQCNLVLYGSLSETLSHPVFNFCLQVFGGTYLLYLAYLMLREVLGKQSEEEAEAEQISSKSYYLKGLVVNITNPKAWLYFLSLFSVWANAPEATQWKVILPFLIVLTQGIGFILVILSCTLKHGKEHYQRLTPFITGLCALLFLGLGLYLWIDSLTTFLP